MGGIVVIGAGQAGFSLVTTLRARGYGGDLTLIGSEPVPPYQRPPLSKKYLLGELEPERLFLRPAGFYAEQGIALRSGVAVRSIDRGARRLHLSDGGTLAYDQLALATGARPRRLPAALGGALAGVHTIRSLADVDAMKADFAPGRRMLVVGGGYIGLEAAAVARMIGSEVVLLETAPRILQRVAAPATSDWFRALHRGRGVDIREGLGLTRLDGSARVERAVLTNGEALAVDAVVVGIGIEPETELAAGAGLAIDNGIAVDVFGRTSDPAVFAAGDCASFPGPDGRLRLESVPNAIDMGEAVAANLLGAGQPYVARPWFWSDQYEVKLQIAGLNAGHDRTVTRPGGREGTQSVWYYRGSRLLAVDAMNDPRAYMNGKRWIEAGISPDPARIADPAADLKALG
jgi:3-phenylpropionate/trans-cinnamate dioxygenase ferredoxin reductase subunit